MLDKRASYAQALLAAHGLDALVFTRLPDIRYLCGFTGSAGVLVVSPVVDCFLTDPRYTTQAAREVVAARQREYTDKVDGILACLDELGARRVGFESEDMTCALLERLRLKGAGRHEWIGLDRQVAMLRGIKDSDELVLLSAAANLAADAFEEILPLIRPGAVEREIALALEMAMRRRGADEKSFDLIVASGERGALPHGTASDKQIAAGELVTVDFGVRRAGYCSDETVTLAVGAIDAEMRRAYDAVYQAQQRALAAVRPGVALQEVDAVARETIDAAGFGAYFVHGLGHGVGLEVHEYPTVSSRSGDTAEVGMVFTIEPGVYLPGKGGVRLEDTVTVTVDGCRKLTRISKEFRQLTC